MKTRAWMLLSCCLGLLAPLPTARAEEPPQGFLKITVGIEGEGLERIPIVGSLLQQLIGSQAKPCAEQEQVKTPPPATECPVMVATEHAVPLLSDLPYVGRLFKNIRLEPAGDVCVTEEVECPGCPATRTIRFVGPDGLERIGIDFDCDVAESCAQCQAKRCAPAHACRPVAACAAPVANGRPVAVCAAPAPTCAPPIAMYPAPVSGYAVQACEVLPAPVATLQGHSFPDRDELIEALMQARVEAAVAQTALKVREESDAQKLELIKEIVSSQVENAKLTAKLELAAEKEKMLAELYEARVGLTVLQERHKRSEVAQRKRQQKDAEARRPAEPVEALR